MDSFKAFKEKLDNEHNWPSIYMFKFVVPKERVQEVEDVFADELLQTKHSKAGNYVSFTIKKLINSSDEVVDMYVEAKKIEGLIAL